MLIERLKGADQQVEASLTCCCFVLVLCAVSCQSINSLNSQYLILKEEQL